MVKLEYNAKDDKDKVDENKMYVRERFTEKSE